ncbi:MAG: LPS export ABC transporter periplasmic protein LptC [Parvularculaceae bacterium]
MTTAVKDRELSAETGQPAPKRRVLDSLPSRARTTGDQAAARSRFVRRMRIALPVLALVLVAAFMVTSRNSQTDDAFLDDFKDFSPKAEELRMASPRFSGIDDNGRPFEIEAEAAKQRQDGQDIVELERPRAVQGNKGKDETTKVTAAKGVYRQDANILELNDDVTLEHDIGDDAYVFHSPAATISLDDEVVTSDSGVGGEGPDGRSITADSMKAYNGEGRVVLEGNVKMRIYPKDKSGEATTSPPELKDPENGTQQ